ncbi:RNA polymerase sigma-70 factor [Bacillus timonensis]|uniref:RNA polymerase sigma-70 factor n=1 Tax=Bacillus timonensis TaxID=1033734 RepID=A0A4S3PRE0_9BACI|nr:RNA polymerase sigma-70 factor [Bacillus timonensis]THE12209.1 RNA polymerase sigma-70 factor [Bacillus timonensis]
MLDEQFYQEHKPLLFSIAYRMTGTITESEDIIHDVLLDFERTNYDKIENTKAYLCKMVTNRSIDYLKSARKQREVYIGPWLPEPLIIHESDPMHAVIVQDNLSYALLSLMEQLSPVERAVFVLREAFGYEYDDIASILEKEEANCRKIISRAKKKLDYKDNVNDLHVNQENLQQLVQSFLRAATTGNVENLLSLLANDSVLYSDGGGKVKAAIVPIKTKERVSQFILGLVRKFGQDAQLEIEIVNVNGQIGILINRNHKPENVICFELENNQITQIFSIRNPEKLTYAISGYQL